MPSTGQCSLHEDIPPLVEEGSSGAPPDVKHDRGAGSKGRAVALLRPTDVPYLDLKCNLNLFPALPRPGFNPVSFCILRGFPSF